MAEVGSSPANQLKERIMEIFDHCPECKGILQFVEGDEPRTIDHLMCDKCDGTYCLDELDKDY